MFHASMHSHKKQNIFDGQKETKNNWCSRKLVRTKEWDDICKILQIAVNLYKLLKIVTNCMPRAANCELLISADNRQLYRKS